MRRWALWGVVLALLGAGLWLGSRFDWLDWVAADGHPARMALEVVSWLAAIGGLAVPVVQRIVDRRAGRYADGHDRLDELADAVLAHWEHEAELRRVRHGSLPVRWDVSKRKVAAGVHAAVAEGARARFAPLPGADRVTRADLKDGGDLAGLYRVYGGLASGRLLLIGEGAAGKTTAGVLLLLEALANRSTAGARRADIPVPVLLELRDWDPSSDSATDWVARSLSRSERLVRGRAGRDWVAAMLRAGRISVFLDGFDEVAPDVRRVMVAKLNEAPFRLVLLSRPKAAVQTARWCTLSGALGLALRPVDAKDAADYLRRRDLPEPAPPAWAAVIEELGDNPGGPLAEALRHPLAVSLLRDAYTDDDPVAELLDRKRFPTVRAIHDRLLDQAVRTAYRPAGGRSRYSAETAERTLRFVAHRLVRNKTHDLAWWHIPTWVPPGPRAAFAGLVAAAGYGPLAVATFGSWQGPVIGFAVPATVVLRMVHKREAQPLDTASRRDIFNWGTLRVGLPAGLVTLVALLLYGGSAMGVATVVWNAVLATLITTVMVSPAAELVSGFPHERLVRLFGVTEADTRQLGEWVPSTPPRAVGPREVWRHHAYGRLVLGFAFGGAIGVWFVLLGLLAGVTDVESPVLSGLTVGIGFALVGGLAVNLAVATIMTTVQLRFTEGIPVRLLRFLEDARKRNLLRVSGQVYQFRHAELRDRLSSPAG